MKKQPIQGLVSLVVASYNHAEYLDRRMESLISQTYPNIEIIVIEDCSTDNSLEVLSKYVSHPKVRLINREKNGGWVAVSNQGIGESSGEYVLFANCDDDCAPTMVEVLVGAIKHNPSTGASFCRSFLVDEDNNVLGSDFDKRENAFKELCISNALINRGQMSKFLVHSCVIPNLSAVLLKRECFDAVGMLSADYRVCSDWEMFFRIAKKYDFAYVAEPLNFFRQHKTTIRSVTKSKVTYEEYLRLLLGQIRTLPLTVYERMKFRVHVMYLWGTHLFANPVIGMRNFPYHFRRVIEIDPLSLLCFIPGMVSGLIKLGKNIINK